MSRENVELARQSFDAVNRRELGAFLALMDEHVEGVSRIAAMEGGLHGHDGMRRWWKSWFDAFPDYAIDVVEFRDRDDLVFAALRAHGHGAGSDLPFEDTVWHASRVAEREVRLVACSVSLGGRPRSRRPVGVRSALARGRRSAACLDRLPSWSCWRALEMACSCETARG
jgi:hypothetical protein